MNSKRLLGPALLLLPVAAYGRADGPPIMRTGAEVDGGLNCTACHRGADANSDPRGKILVWAAEYQPGVAQKLKVRVQHPDAERWGFQLSPRLASDPSKAAGTLNQSPGIRVQCAGGAPDGNCGTNLAFASQNVTSVQVGQRGAAEWEVEWVPPAANSGEVIIYFAGNAANNSGNNQGDTVYTGAIRVAEAGRCALTAAPTISSVRNAASFDSSASFNTLLTIAGTNFGAAGQVRSADQGYIIGDLFPKTLGCLAVDIAGQRAPILYSQFNQINVQAPTVATTGNVEVRVIANPGQTNELRSAAATVELTPTAPAFFRLLPTPCIVGVFTGTAQITGDPSLLDYTRGAKIGDLLTLYATGLGITEPVYQAGEIAPLAPVRTRDAISIEVNGTPIPAADILYAGLAPGLTTGLYQINIRVPAGVRPNSHNQVRIRAGNRLSAEGTTLFIAPN